MSDPLSTYLHDHLAGSNFAIQLLETLRDQNTGEPLGTLASTLLVDVQEDRDVLQGVLDRVGRHFLDLKEAAAWATEKLSRWKLRHDSAGSLGTLEALETLALGILGKAGLWRALSAVSKTDKRVLPLDFERLGARAQAQYDKVEEARLQMIGSVFQPAAV